jgi:hypothetical protein
MPIFPAMWEVKIGGSQFETNPEEKMLGRFPSQTGYGGMCL